MTGIAVSLGSGIHRISRALPPSGPKTVNCYVVEGAEGLTLIDCGTNMGRELNTLVEGLAQIAGGEVALERLVCTHLHFDHMGGAAALLSDHPAEFVMHRSAGERVNWDNDPDTHRENLVRLVREHGGPSPEAALLGAPWQHRTLRGSASCRAARWTTVTGSNSGRVATSRWSTHRATTEPTSAWSTASPATSSAATTYSPGSHPFVPYDPDRDSLGDYLRSLRRIEKLDPCRTLPGHGEPLEKGGARAREISLHHDERLRAVARATAGRTADAWGVTTRVFGAHLDPIGRILALLETLSHLEHLVCTGRMTKRVEECLWYYGE